MSIDEARLRALVVAGLAEGGNEILALLESQLRASGNPLGNDPEMWRQYRAQAGRVISECIEQLRDEHVAGGGASRAGGPADDRLDDVPPDRIRAVQRAERRRSAREIHDRIGNRISLAVRHLDLYEIYRDRDPQAAAAKIAGIRSVLEDLLDSTRRLMSDLRLENPVRSPALALRRFVAAVDPAVAVDVTVQGDERLIPTEHRDELFVVLREALRNVFAHAHATRAAVLVTVLPQRVTAVVEDDGTGFDPDSGRSARRRRNGLDSMRERVELLGGSWTIASSPAKGTRVEITIPFPRPEVTS